MERKCLLFLVICLVVGFFVLPVSAFAADAVSASVCGEDAHIYDNGFCAVCDGYQAAMGSGTADQPYEIANAGQLYWFAEQVNSGSTDVWGVLVADIVINTQVLTEDGALNGDGSGFRQWTPIGNGDAPYSGTFDGDGKTISGIYFSDDNAEYVGFFGRIATDGTVKNVEITNSYICGDYRDCYTGGVVGHNSGIVMNCYNIGTVRGNSFVYWGDCYVGGVVGYNYNGTVEDCYNSSTVKGSGDYCYTGGVVGINDNGTVESCYNTGDVRGYSGEFFCYTGGVVGSNSGTVNNCYNSCTVYGDGFGGSGTGGVVGSNSGTVKNCYNSCTVYDEGVGDSYAGGVVGYNSGTVASCYNTDAVSGSCSCFYGEEYSYSDSYAGGVVGSNSGTVMDCYNTGTVSGESGYASFSYCYSGGVVGASLGDVNDCYNTGTVSGVAHGDCYVGGVVGYNRSGGVMSDCYYDSQGFDGNAVGENAGTVTNVDGKTGAQFESGEVAYLLGAPFGQNIDNGKENEGRPVFSDAIVYERIDCLGWTSGTYSNYDVVAHRYGSSDDICMLCGEKHVHSYEGRKVDPTCTEQGYTRFYCIGCGDGYSGGYVEALGHHYEQVVTGPTCTTQGYTTHTCAVCGYICKDSYVEMLPHDYQSEVTEPTCTEEGYTTHTCTVCGDSYKDGYVAKLTHTYEAVVMEPTCTAQGYTTHTCTGCGDSYVVDQTEALGHSYVEGVCSGCGLEVKQPGLVLDHPSLSFEDEIFYNVYYSVDDMTSVVEMGLMILPSRMDHATIEDALDMIGGYTANGTMYMVRSEGVPAACMGDTVYFKIYAKLVDGSYAYSAAAGYNAKAYAYTVLNGDHTDQMKALVVSMLNYGAEAQRYFNHNEDLPVNGTLTEEQKAMIDAYDSTMMDAVVKADSTKTGDLVRVNSDFKQLYPSVSFDSAFAINFYCAPAINVDGGMTLYYWDMETMASVDELALDNAVGSMEMTESGGVWWGQVDGIAAKDMDKTYYITCMFESEGRMVTSGIISYSLGRYCTDKAAADGDASQDLAKATAVYGYYAKRYFAPVA